MHSYAAAPLLRLCEYKPITQLHFQQRDLTTFPQHKQQLSTCQAITSASVWLTSPVLNSQKGPYMILQVIFCWTALKQKLQGMMRVHLKTCFLCFGGARDLPPKLLFWNLCLVCTSWWATCNFVARCGNPSNLSGWQRPSWRVLWWSKHQGSWKDSTLDLLDTLLFSAQSLSFTVAKGRHVFRYIN